MNYFVIWLPNAEQELADLWINSSERGAITRAAAILDQLLASDPVNEGESRPNGRRILFAAPLAAIYRIYPDQEAGGCSARLAISHFSGVKDVIRAATVREQCNQPLPYGRGSVCSGLP